MRLRLGLTDGQPRTLDEVGRVYGVTRERKTADRVERQVEAASE